MKAQSTTQTKTSSATVLDGDRSGILQRKCETCGQHTIAGAECAECGKQKNVLQRRANNPSALGDGLSLSHVPVMQAKLTIGASDDPLEQEADQIADQVLAAPAYTAINGAPPRIQRFAGQTTRQADTAPASVDQTLTSPGRPLEPSLQQDMEQHFGHDFSRVRVHTGGAAERSARDVSAHAYTSGHNIVFGAGQFAPGTHGGRRLLAHELAHVVQQSGSEGNRFAPSDEKRGLSPIIPNTLGTGSPVNGISRVAVTRIQREEISADDTKPQDESLGLGESIVIEGLAAGATVGMPSLKPVIKGGFTGFYTEIRHQIKEGKGQQFMNRVKKLLVSPGDMVAYGKGYLWGILQGLWSPVQGLVDIVKLAWKLQQWQIQTIANVIQNFHEIATMQGNLIDRFSKLGGKAKAFFEGIKNNAMEFVGRLMDAISGGVFELAKTGGHKAGQAIFRFLEKPWGEIGEGVGTVVGTVLIEVILAVFSGGIGNALTKVGQALDKVAPTLMKGVRFIASELGTIITEIRGVVETIKAGLAKAGRTLLKGFEEFIGEAGSIFDDLIAMLKKLFSGAEDAATKLPIDVPLPVKAPAPHIPASHLPPVAKPPHVEAGPVKKPHAEPLAPKEPNVEVGAPEKPQVELTQPKEPPITKPQADAVTFVKENPNVIKGEPGHRRASVGEGHEIVEIPDRNLPSGIGCELHSSPPHPKVPCPAPMGNKGKETIEQFKQRGGEVEKLEPGKMPKKSPSEITAVSEPTPPEGFEDIGVPSRTKKQAGVSVAEDHHIATRYRKENKKLFESIGFDIDGDLNLIKDFEEHGQLRGWEKWDQEKKVFIHRERGHHPGYNKWATEQLKSSVKGLTGEQARTAFKSAAEKLSSIVKKYPDVLAYGPEIFSRSNLLK